MATTLQNYRDIPALNITLHHIIPSIHPHLVSCGELGFVVHQVSLLNAY